MSKLQLDHIYLRSRMENITTNIGLDSKQ